MTRRYAIIHVSDDDVIEEVRVVTGDTLASLDTTGTLTQKFQARLIPGTSFKEIIVAKDTKRLLPFVDELALQKYHRQTRSMIHLLVRCFQ